MLEHSTFIIASYTAAALILTWCALSPVLRTRKVREQLFRAFRRQRSEGGR